MLQEYYKEQGIDAMEGDVHDHNDTRADTQFDFDFYVEDLMTLYNKDIDLAVLYQKDVCRNAVVQFSDAVELQKPSHPAFIRLNTFC